MKLHRNIALSDTGFVFNPASGDSFSVNPIGLSILKDFKDGKTEKEIIDKLVSEYNTTRETAERDLFDFKRMIGQFRLSESE
jgi:hypothetical protein